MTKDPVTHVSACMYPVLCADICTQADTCAQMCKRADACTYMSRICSYLLRALASFHFLKLISIHKLYADANISQWHRTN